MSFIVGHFMLLFVFSLSRLSFTENVFDISLLINLMETWWDFLTCRSAAKQIYHWQKETNWIYHKAAKTQTQKTRTKGFVYFGKVNYVNNPENLLLSPPANEKEAKKKEAKKKWRQKTKTKLKTVFWTKLISFGRV